MQRAIRNLLIVAVLFVLAPAEGKRWIPPQPSAVCTTSGYASGGSFTFTSDALANGNIYWADTFVADATYTACKAVARLNKVGSPTGNIDVQIWTDSSGTPGALIGTQSDVVAASTVGSNTDITFVNMSASITSGTTYWVVIHYPSGTNSNYVQPEMNANGSTNKHSADGSIWGTGGEPAAHLMFTLYHN